MSAQPPVAARSRMATRHDVVASNGPSTTTVMSGRPDFQAAVARLIAYPSTPARVNPWDLIRAEALHHPLEPDLSPEGVVGARAAPMVCAPAGHVLQRDAGALEPEEPAGPLVDDPLDPP